MDALAELCPMFVGSKAITLSLQDPLSTLRAFSPVFIDVDYSGAGDVGVRLPLELMVTSKGTFTRTYYRRVLPDEIVITPKEGGPHLVVLREMGHHRLLGRLTFEVSGDELLEA